MAYEAERVVVELIAKTDQLDRPVKQSATQFDQSMNQITASATKAEQAVTKSSGARVAAIQREAAQVSQFQKTLARDMDIVSAKMLSASSPFVAPVKQAPAVRSAMRLISTSASVMGGILGGFAVSAATELVAALAELIIKSQGTSAEIAALVDKLKEHARQTYLSEEADRIWSNTLDGLIERQGRLKAERDKRLKVQAAVDQADLASARKDAAGLSKELNDERVRLADTKAQLSKFQNDPIAQAEFGRSAGVRLQQLKQQVRASEEEIKRLEVALNKAQGRITEGQIIVGEAQGKAIADLTARAERWADLQTNILRTLEQTNPELAKSSTALSSSFETMKKAITDAAAAGVNFDATTKRSDQLNNQLRDGQVTVRSCTGEILKLAKALQAQADAAKEAAKQDPVKQFKQSVIGAEGTGPNQLGSSAAGFGQFMPSTWLSYFNRLFPDKADLSDAAKLAYRNVRGIAEAVIDKATDDY